ncbi:hypothetical protein F441_15185 [Phytophthora nicotianae CJ01A1]|uniref:Uncharacterized protein n=1 Tax=Phytophthora nicotianae CJ01A1 TaxID=1317063 RepID=W2WH58_PHYNI|nr:hypothetical protein F441_15185 [Phytophthora nicotianae CJ01A1]
MVCVSYPAVNAAGEVTGGLKGTNGNDACKYAPQGSQVYGRAGWYKDLWAIMYAWYFPKGFGCFPRRDVMTGRASLCGLTILLWKSPRLSGSPCPSLTRGITRQPKSNHHILLATKDWIGS